MMTLLDHLAELRSKILLCFFAVALGAAVAHYYHEHLIALLLKPIHGEQLYFLSPLDPLLFVLKIDLYCGAVLALPVINWSILSFVRPAMARSSWFLFSALYCMTAVLVLGGLAYAYFVIVPVSLRFLTSITVPGVESMITANSYLTFVLTQSLITASVFQIPLFVVAGAYIGAFRMRSLARRRPHIYFAAIIVLSVLTPTTDLFNLGIMLVPTLAMFELSLLTGRIVEFLTSSERRV